MKKLIGLLLMLACILPLAAGCASCGKTPPDVPKDSSEEATGDTGEPYYLDTLPRGVGDLDTFRIMTIQGNIPSEKAMETQNFVAQSLWTRDVRMEDRYGIRFAYRAVENSNQAVEDMRIAASNNDGSAGYHAFITSAMRLMNLSANGYTQNLNSVENLDLDRRWWNQSLRTTLNLGGKLYISAGPYSEFYYHSAICLAYNKQIAAAHDISGLYETVDAGEWTLEQMRIYCTEYDVTVDVNEDGMNEEDIYSISAFNGILYGLFAGAGGSFSTVSEEGRVVCNLTRAEDEALVTELAGIFRDGVTTYYGNYKPSADIFTQNQALFLYTSTGYINDYLPSSRVDYGILPLPKKDQLQKNYVTCAWPSSNYCVSIPYGLDAENRQFAGLMLGAYCFLSYEVVRPVKYEKVLQNQVAPDPDAKRMLDLLFDTLYFDLNLVYDFGQSRTLISETIRTGNTAAYLTEARKNLPKVTDAINKLLTGGN